VSREAMSPADWKKRCDLDLLPLLREAVFLQCALGRQASALGDRAWDIITPEQFRSPDSFRRAIETQAEV